MLNVTLVRLAPDARSADTEFGQGSAMELSTEEFSERLEAFRELDPLQNAHADPEIRVQAGGQKYVVRTGQGKLFLYNVRDHTQPAQILSTAEVLAELDGSAHAARTAAPFPGVLIGQTQSLEEVIAPPVPSRPWRGVAWALVAVLVLLVAGVAGAYWMERIHALPEADATAIGQALEGVYVDGPAAARGIVFGRDGAVRTFATKGDEPPAIVFDRWRATRENGAVRLQLVERQVPVEIVDADTINVGGERYRRAAKP